MESFTISEVSKESFDVSLLTYDKEELSILADKMNDKYLLTLQEQRKIYLPDSYYYNHVYTGRIFFDLIESDVQSTNWQLRFIFNESIKSDFLDLLNFAYSSRGDNDHLIKSYVQDTIRGLSVLHDKVFTDSKESIYRDSVIDYGLVKKSLAIAALKKNGPDYFSYSTQQRLLEFVSPDDAVPFTLSKNEDIKVLAYKKLGMVNYIDKMLSDKSAKIREIAVSYMDFGDIRIKSLTKEKTKKVLYSAISKAPADILPFFIGNDVIKKDYGLTDLFRRRMEESTG